MVGADLGMFGLSAGRPEGLQARKLREGTSAERFLRWQLLSRQQKASVTDAHSACEAGGKKTPGDHGAEGVPGKHKQSC